MNDMTARPKNGILPRFPTSKGNEDMKQIIAESVLNPSRFHLSKEAKKRLRWMYTIEYECGGNITRASKKASVSREWLTKLHAAFVLGKRNPRSLEPKSRAPHRRTNRRRISSKVECLIKNERKKHPAWGKEKISRILVRDHDITVSSSTVGRYLKKNGLVDVKLTLKNERAWKRRKILKNGTGSVRERSPKGLADAGPGALIAKDMKLIEKPGVSRPLSDPMHRRTRDLFRYQLTMIDSCSRRRVVSIVEEATSRKAKEAYIESSGRFPFGIAAVTSDNGGENDGEFDLHLRNENVLHFWSRPGVPTDNPRVERSHLSDDLEFYRFDRQALASFEKHRDASMAWDRVWNDERPHQALGYLTPSEYEDLWKTNRDQAIAIQKKWNDYLKKQSLRLRAARRERKEESINALNAHLRVKLQCQFQPLKV